jgi:hypothetical protein
MRPGTGPLPDQAIGRLRPGQTVEKYLIRETGDGSAALSSDGQAKRRWAMWISLCALAIAAVLSLCVLATLAAETGYAAPGRSVA